LTGHTSQGDNSVAVGNAAGSSNQGTFATAVGDGAGYSAQGTQSVAMGYVAGRNNQGDFAAAIGAGAGQVSQGNNAVAMGYVAGNTSQGGQCVAIGWQAGRFNQVLDGVAIGRRAGESGQKFSGVAIGNEAGLTSQGNQAVAVGYRAGQTSQGIDGVAIGINAGYSAQGPYTVAVGHQPGHTSQGERSVAIGTVAGYSNQGIRSVAIGNQAAWFNQGSYATAVGPDAGQTGQGDNATAVGREAGAYNQGVLAVAVGVQSALTSQGAAAVAMGYVAGLTGQGASAVAVGHEAGRFNQGGNATAVGRVAAVYSQGFNSVAVGHLAGYSAQQYNSVAIGVNAAAYNQEEHSVAIGDVAGYSAQGIGSVAIGNNAGQNNQATWSVAVGKFAGAYNQGQYSTAVGLEAGQSVQGAYSVALGRVAGRYNQGTYAIAIGNGAGQNSQAGSSIVICANDIGIDATANHSLYIKSLRNINGTASIRMYRHSSHEITWGSESSDDRLKINETLITNAVSTLMKLRPEKYDKLLELNGHSSNAVPEFGLIAQEVWYNAPELRLLVQPGVGAVPGETADIPDDPQQDPDYSSWGTRPAGFVYDGLIPWLIKGVQEIHNELPRHRTKVPSALYSNISQYTGMIVSKSPTISLSNVVNDKSYFGIITDKPLDTKDSEILVQSTGEGYVWVTDVNGSLESGDLITTSNIDGYGIKQDDDLVHSYTVAKSTMHCDFNPQQVPIKRIVQQLSDVKYWTFTQQKEITESDYDLIAENQRNKITKIYYSSKEGGKPEITEDEYNQLEPSVQSEYSLEREVSMHYKIETREVTTNPNDDMYTLEVRQELVDVLDENGQQTWEDTDETEPMYTVIDHGTYKAALISCKLI
jgi:hypothetical protein